LNSRKSKIPFFTDNDVDDALGEFLKDSGHSVTRLRDVMLTDSPDPIVATACREAGLVLITHNVRHFKAISQKQEHSTGRPDKLCRIEMECHQVDSVDRMKIALPTIESEWDLLGAEKQGLRITVAKRLLRICK